MKREEIEEKAVDNTALQFWSAATGMTAFSEAARAYAKLASDWQEQALQHFTTQFGHLPGADAMVAMWKQQRAWSAEFLDHTIKMCAQAGQAADATKRTKTGEKPARPEAAE